MINFRVSYDLRADVLYVSTERNGPAHACEGDDGIIWRYLDSDGSLVGVTIMDFDAYWRQHMNELVNQMASQFGVPSDSARGALAHAHG